MENNLQVFNNPEFGQVRLIQEGEKTLFCASDIAKALGYTNVSKAINDHCRWVTKRYIPHPQSKSTTIEVNFIPEGDVYRLMAKSKLPGAGRFESWIFDEVLPEINRTGSYISPAKSTHTSGYREKEATARLMNARSRQSKIWMQLADTTSIKELKEVAQVYAANTLAGKEILALPEVKEKTYTATEIADMLGTSKNMIGRIATKYNLKTEAYGKMFYDKSPYSNKEVETFRYYERAIDEFRKHIAN